LVARGAREARSARAIRAVCAAIFAVARDAFAKKDWRPDRIKG
jgi:hypothetical protein